MRQENFAKRRHTHTVVGARKDVLPESRLHFLYTSGERGLALRQLFSRAGERPVFSYCDKRARLFDRNVPQRLLLTRTDLQTLVFCQVVDFRRSPVRVIAVHGINQIVCCVVH